MRISDEQAKLKGESDGHTPVRMLLSDNSEIASGTIEGTHHKNGILYCTMNVTEVALASAIVPGSGEATMEGRIPPFKIDILPRHLTMSSKKDFDVDINSFDEALRVSLDLFHAHQRIPTYVGHPLNHALHVSLVKAFSDFDEEDMERYRLVKSRAQESIDADFNSVRGLDKVLKHVRRKIPSPSVLTERVQNVIDKFKNKKDENGVCLFSQRVVDAFDKLMMHIKSGCLSDPEEEGILEKLYIQISVDKSGLPVYHCCRGTK